MGHFHLKTHFAIGAFPNFSSRLLPSVSARFRGLPHPQIFFNSNDMTVGGAGALKPKFLGQFLP